jgi:hypothetical protein
LLPLYEITLFENIFLVSKLYFVELALSLSQIWRVEFFFFFFFFYFFFFSSSSSSFFISSSSSFFSSFISSFFSFYFSFSFSSSFFFFFFFSLGTATSSVGTEQVVSSCYTLFFCLVLRGARLESLLRPLLFLLGLLLVFLSYCRLKIYIYIYFLLLHLILFSNSSISYYTTNIKVVKFQFSVLRCSMFFFPGYNIFNGLY